MKPFSQWVSDMAGSIEDASTIVKDTNGYIVVPTPRLFAEKYSDVYDGPYKQLTQAEIIDGWNSRYDDYDDSYFD